MGGRGPTSQPFAIHLISWSNQRPITSSQFPGLLSCLYVSLFLCIFFFSIYFSFLWRRTKKGLDQVPRARTHKHTHARILALCLSHTVSLYYSSLSLSHTHKHTRTPHGDALICVCDGRCLVLKRLSLLYRCPSLVWQTIPCLLLWLSYVPLCAFATL